MKPAILVCFRYFGQRSLEIESGILCRRISSWPKNRGIVLRLHGDSSAIRCYKKPRVLSRKAASSAAWPANGIAGPPKRMAQP